MIYKLDELIDKLTEIEYVDCTLPTKEAEDLLDSFYGYLENAMIDLECIKDEILKAENE